MSDKTNAEKSEAEREAKQNADAIKDTDKTAQGPRGNVHSEPEDDPDINAPPPRPS